MTAPPPERHHAAVLICRRCGSSIIDVNHWLDDETAVVRCYHCCAAAELKGFTLGRVSVSRETLAKVRGDAARLPQQDEIVALPDELGLPEFYAGEQKVFGRVEDDDFVDVRGDRQ